MFPSSQGAELQEPGQTWRRDWTIISWVLLPVAALGAVLTALKETPGPERVTTRRVCHRDNQRQ